MRFSSRCSTRRRRRLVSFARFPSLAALIARCSAIFLDNNYPGKGIHRNWIFFTRINPSFLGFIESRGPLVLPLVRGGQFKAALKRLARVWQREREREPTHVRSLSSSPFSFSSLSFTIGNSKIPPPLYFIEEEHPPLLLIVLTNRRRELSSTLKATKIVFVYKTRPRSFSLGVVIPRIFPTVLFHVFLLLLLFPLPWKEESNKNLPALDEWVTLGNPFHEVGSREKFIDVTWNYYRGN